AEAPAPARRAPRRKAPAPHGATSYRGATAGPYEREGTSYEVRLERVPGALRLAEWSGGRLERRAPVLAAGDVTALVEAAAAAGVLEPDEHDALVEAVSRPVDEPAAGTGTHGASPGRSGELQEELRVERVDGDRLRVARWVLRPGTGWDQLDAPTMLPARRYAEALGDAARRGLLG
ncbi:MAG TPA: hypothetical protein VGV57_09835, partial [Thermoleophilaceae bacterium]|nr:hypothetical protein [Thermoleophilaceae bacterium]